MKVIAEPATIGVHGLVKCVPIGRRGGKGGGVVWELAFAFTGLAADVALGGHELFHSFEFDHPHPRIDIPAKATLFIDGIPQFFVVLQSLFSVDVARLVVHEFIIGMF